jgi:hypothetical protein
MLANYLGYDFIGSDIKTNYAEQNVARRKTTNFYTQDKQFDIFTHDITQPLKENSLFMERGGTGTVGDFKKDMLVVTE